MYSYIWLECCREVVAKVSGPWCEVLSFICSDTLGTKSHAIFSPVISRYNRTLQVTYLPLRVRAVGLSGIVFEVIEVVHVPRLSKSN